MAKLTQRRKDGAQQQTTMQMLHRLIERNNGSITSATNGKYLRVECPDGSSLPTRLTSLGYRVRHTDTANVIEIRL